MGMCGVRRLTHLTPSFARRPTPSTLQKLVAGVYNGYIYTSTDSGATWTEATDLGSRSWQALASSDDGTVR